MRWSNNAPILPRPPPPPPFQILPAPVPVAVPTAAPAAATAPTTAAPAEPPVCAIGSRCREKGNPFAELMECAAVGCQRHIHKACYEFIKKKLEITTDTVIQFPGVSSTVVAYFCRKACRKRILRALQESPPSLTKRLQWDDDELSILLQWITTDGNYARWSGEQGETKHAIAREIAEYLLRQTGIPRDGRSVENKMTYLENQFQRACEWVQVAGRRVWETDGPLAFRKSARKLCPAFFEFLTVQGISPDDIPFETLADMGPPTDDSFQEESDADEEDAMDQATQSLLGSLKTPATSRSPGKKISSMSRKRSLESRTSTKSSKRVLNSKGVASANTEGRSEEDAVEVDASHYQLEKEKVKRETRRVGMEETRLGNEMEINKRRAQAEERKLSVEQKLLEAKAGMAELERRNKLMESRLKWKSRGAPQEDIDRLFPLPSTTVANLPGCLDSTTDPIELESSSESNKSDN